MTTSNGSPNTGDNRPTEFSFGDLSELIAAGAAEASRNWPNPTKDNLPEALEYYSTMRGFPDYLNWLITPNPFFVNSQGHPLRKEDGTAYTPLELWKQEHLGINIILTLINAISIQATLLSRLREIMRSSEVDFTTGGVPPESTASLLLALFLQHGLSVEVFNAWWNAPNPLLVDALGVDLTPADTFDFVGSVLLVPYVLVNTALDHLKGPPRKVFDEDTERDEQD
jgi:hypothetical protein